MEKPVNCVNCEQIDRKPDTHEDSFIGLMCFTFVQIHKLAITGKYPILEKFYFLFGTYSILRTVYLVEIVRVKSCSPVVYEFNL